MSESLWAELVALMEVHDGDDRCECLRLVVSLVYGDNLIEAVAVMRECIAEHPAGTTWRRQQVDKITGEASC